MSAIVSESYRDEIEDLLADPIIASMAREIAPATMPGAVDLDSWSFVRTASSEYYDRGGSGAHSIGGPASAIREYLRRFET